MNSDKDRVSLLSEMIAFSLVDGELHHLEILFLTDIAEKLEISKSVYSDLFSRKYEPTKVKDPFSKIVHYYRLALLMHSDGKLHINEQKELLEIGTRMELTTKVMTVILEMVSEAKNKEIPTDNLLKVFNLQYN